MDLIKIKNQWNEYCDEFENSDYMDIDKHTSMSLKIGGLIQEIERQQEERKELISLNLWSARRLHNIHKKFAYDELEIITGEVHERI